MDNEAKLLTFFDLYKRQFVQVAKVDVTKFIFTDHHGNTRYGLHGIVTDGQSANKFIDEQTWRTLDVPLRS